MIETKKCSKCGEIKPSYDYSYSDLSKGFSLDSQCKDCKRKMVRDYYSRNPDKRRESSAQYRHKNPEKIKETRRRREAIKLDAVVSAPPNIRALLFDIQGGKCIYCQIALMWGKEELDHIIPLATGGSHTPNNLALTCIHCNRSKKDTPLDHWLSWKYPDKKREILLRVAAHIGVMRARAIVSDYHISQTD